MVFATDELVSWSSAAGSQPLTLYADDDGYAAPGLMLDALGTGNSGVRFNGNKMTAPVAWSFANLTAIWVGNVNSEDLPTNYPRWLSLANYGLSEQDWTSAHTWVVGCYDRPNGSFVADRNGARPIDVPFDASRHHIFTTRKSGAEIKAWLRPFGEATVEASGATSAANFQADTFSVGGNNEPQNLMGAVGHIAIWNRALSDAEVLAAQNYLGGLYGG